MLIIVALLNGFCHLESIHGDTNVERWQQKPHWLSECSI